MNIINNISNFIILNKEYIPLISTFSSLLYLINSIREKIFGSFKKEENIPSLVGRKITVLTELSRYENAAGAFVSFIPIIGGILLYVGDYYRKMYIHKCIEAFAKKQAFDQLFYYYANLPQKYQLDKEIIDKIFEYLGQNKESEQALNFYRSFPDQIKKDSFFIYSAIYAISSNLSIEKDLIIDFFKEIPKEVLKEEKKEIQQELDTEKDIAILIIQQVFSAKDLMGIYFSLRIQLKNSKNILDRIYERYTHFQVIKNITPEEFKNMEELAKNLPLAIDLLNKIKNFQSILNFKF